MPDLYLRFADPDQAVSCLQTVGIQVEQGGALPVDGADFALDLVFGTGVIQQPTGEFIQMADDPIAIMAPLPGYHVNLRWRGETVPDGFVPYLIQPQSPALLWV